MVESLKEAYLIVVAVLMLAAAQNQVYLLVWGISQFYKADKPANYPLVCTWNDDRAVNPLQCNVPGHQVMTFATLG